MGSITISKALAYQYRVPLKRPFTTSRHTTTRSTNILVELEAEGVAGIGEAVPRNRLTGDVRSRNWRVVRAMLRSCKGADIDVSSREAACASVAAIYAKLQRVAERNVQEQNRDKPYRGLLSGFEIALLDLAARVRGETLAELLGLQRTHVHATATTTSTHHAPEVLEQSFAKHRRRYNAYRCKGAEDPGENIRRLEVMEAVDRKVGSVATHWLDLNEAMSPEAAESFVGLLIERLRQGGSQASRIMLEQPVSKEHVDTLARLQALADDSLPRERGRIVIMADESLWDLQDFKRIVAAGGCGAINIKIPKVGGLLKALELGRYVEEHAPETEIYVGGMIGTSDITARAIYSLAAALPRIDHCTTSPAQNVAENMAASMIGFESETSARVVMGDGLGLGTEVNRSALEKYTIRQASADAETLRAVPPPPVEDLPAECNVYDDPQLLMFGQKSVDSHLLERECLVRGWRITRRTSNTFQARDEAGSSLKFYWSYMPILPMETRLLCRKKYLTKALFANFGVPVAEGRCFRMSDRDKAVEYALGLGWPLVVKPGIGTGGVGVTAGITNQDELDWALNHLVENEKARKRNDGFCIIERHVPGTELRVTVVNGRAVSAIQRLQAAVVGDGKHTVQELVAIRDSIRATNPRLRNSPSKLTEKGLFQLKKQGLTPETVPAEGQRVILSPVASISQGADTRSVLDEVHPSVQKACVDAVRSVPYLNFAGVDIIVEDFRRPLEGQAAAVCEVNTSPSFAASHFPMYGPRCDVAREIVDMYAGEHGMKSAVRHDDTLAAIVNCRNIEVPREVADWISGFAAQHGLRGDSRTVSSTEVEVRLKGAARMVAAVATLCAQPPMGYHRKSVVRTRLVEPGEVPDKAF